MTFLREVPQPLAQMRGDLNRVVRQNQPPLLDQQNMLELLQLNGPERDGRSLAQRLFISKNPLNKVCPPTGEQVYVLNQTIVLIGQLLGRLAEGSEDDNQLAEVVNLVAVAERQIVREQEICPMASDLYLKVGSTRPDMVNVNIYRELAFQRSLSGMMDLITRAVQSGQLGIEIVEIRQERD